MKPPREIFHHLCAHQTQAFPREQPVQRQTRRHSCWTLSLNISHVFQQRFPPLTAKICNRLSFRPLTAPDIFSFLGKNIPPLDLQRWDFHDRLASCAAASFPPFSNPFFRSLCTRAWSPFITICRDLYWVHLHFPIFLSSRYRDSSLEKYFIQPLFKTMI